MLYHTAICVEDPERAVHFYDKVLATIGMVRIFDLMPNGVGYGRSRADFWVQREDADAFLRISRNAHFCFSAETEELVVAFHAQALASGGSSILLPAKHPRYGPHYMGTIVADLDGHLVECCFIRDPGVHTLINDRLGH